MEYFHALPDGVRGVVYDFLPRHDTAKLLIDAINDNNLKLKYVRNTVFVCTGSLGLPIDWDHRLVPNNNNILNCHLKELRPTKLLSDTYGGGTIARTDISVGERVRLRAIRNGISKLRSQTTN